MVNPVIREEMKKKFLAMYDHITDQGVAYGSCWGNIHHYGYSVRGLRHYAGMRLLTKYIPKPEVNGIDMDSSIQHFIGTHCQYFNDGRYTGKNYNIPVFLPLD